MPAASRLVRRRAVKSRRPCLACRDRCHACDALPDHVTSGRVPPWRVSPCLRRLALSLPRAVWTRRAWGLLRCLLLPVALYGLLPARLKSGQGLCGQVSDGLGLVSFEQPCPVAQRSLAAYQPKLLALEFVGDMT